MIRTHLIPQNTDTGLSVPKSYVGKQGTKDKASAMENLQLSLPNQCIL